MIFGQFGDSFPPMIDGVSNVVMNYAKILNEQYGKSYLITPRYPKTDTVYPYEIRTFRSHVVPGRNEYRWGLGQLDLKFWKEVSQIPFDLVHTHSPFSCGLVARQIARDQGIPIVITFHTKYKDDFLNVIKSEFLVDNMMVKNIVKYFESVDEVWTVNESSVETLREYGYYGDVHVVHNGCDMPVTDPCDDIRCSVFEKFNLDQSAPLFLFIGRMTENKNIYMLLDALGLLHNSGVNYNMLMIGDGPDRIGFEERVNALGIGPKVHFTGSIADRKLINRIYAAADAMLFSSLYDTSSLVPREASACLCPTVFVEGSTTAQGIVDGKNGFLAKNEPAAFAEKIKQIAEAPSLAREVGTGARASLYRPWSDSVREAYDRYLLLIDRKTYEKRRAR